LISIQVSLALKCGYYNDAMLATLLKIQLSQYTFLGIISSSSKISAHARVDEHPRVLVINTELRPLLPSNNPPLKPFA